MAGLKKDVELIFRGEDRASPTIKGVRDSVRSLTDAVSEQVAAAERGEGSIDDLAKVYRRLKDAQQDVGEITRLAAAYDSLIAKHEEQTTKARELSAAEAALAAQVAEAANPTKRLTNARDAAARKAEAAAAKEKELAAAVEQAGAAFQAAGGDLGNFEASQESIRAAALETAKALSTGRDALENYNASAAKGVKVKAGVAENDRFNALAAGSGLPQAQIAFISQLENRIEALSAAIKEATASESAFNREVSDRAAADAAQRVRAAAAAYDEAASAAERLQTATAFKSQAAGIAAGAADISRFGAAADTAATSGRRLADTLQAISAPAQGASRSLEGIDSIVAKSEALFDGSKRRMSEYTAGLNDLSAAQAGMAGIARTIDDFRDQEAALKAATAAMEAQQAEVLRLAAAISQADAPTQRMADDLVRAEAALQRTGGAVTAETAKLKQLEGSLESAGVDTRNLAAAEVQLEGAALRAAAAQTKLRGVGSGAGGFLGLNPNEMQNLGYQVNDIFVSLASGQKPLTVFVQQGAQIGQIFPGAFAKIAARIPVIAALLAVVVPLGAAMLDAAKGADRLAEATSNIGSMGEVASGVDPKHMAAMADEVERLGVKAKDTNKIMRDLAADGLNAGQMEAYIAAAKEASKVTGDDFKTSLETLRTSFQGGMDDINKLQESTGVYKDAELDLIQTLYDHGQADEARATALEIYSQRMGEAAAKSEGPWRRAIENLGEAWHGFVHWLGQTTVFQAAGNLLDWLGKKAAYWAARLAKKSPEEALAEANGTVKPGHVAISDPMKSTVAGRQAIKDQQDALAAAKATTPELKRQLAVQKALQAAQSAGAHDFEAQQAAKLAGAAFDVTEGERQRKSGESAAKRAEAARKREAAAAAAAARQIAQMEEQLARSLEQLDSAVAAKQDDSLQTRLDGIKSQYAALFRSIDEYDAKTKGRGKIGNQTISEARQHVTTQQTALENYATMDFQEKQLQELLKARSERLDEINDKVARGLIPRDQGLLDANDVIAEIADKMTAVAQDGLAFAKTIAGVTPSPQLAAFIAKMDTAIQNNSGGQNQRLQDDRRKAAINDAEGELNNIVSARNALIEHENYLVELGLQTRTQAQANIKAEYADTRDLIQGQTADILKLASAFKDSADPAMRLFYENLAARLEAVNIQTQPIDANFAKLKDGFNQLATSNIIEFIDQVAQSFAKLATGQGDVLDFFASIGRAFLDMIAKTLQGIAMLILQVIILDTVDKFTGGLVKPLLKLYGGSGVFHEGGVVGQVGGRSRQVSPLAFAGVPRYHTGGIAGLAPDERGAILRVGEEVLKETDPRHRNNGGLSTPNAGPSKIQKAVLAVGDDQIAAAMAGSAGEDVTMFHLRRNKSAIKQMLDN